MNSHAMGMIDQNNTHTRYESFCKGFIVIVHPLLSIRHQPHHSVNIPGKKQNVTPKSCPHRMVRKPHEMFEELHERGVPPDKHELVPVCDPCNIAGRIFRLY